MVMRHQGWLAGGRRWAPVTDGSSWSRVAGALPGVGSSTLRTLELVFAPEVPVSAGRSGALGLACCPLTAFSLTLRLVSGQTSSHRSLQTTVANMGSTFFLARCIPGPLSRASTTNLLALSTTPPPMGYPLAWNSAYLIRSLRFSRYSRLPLTTFDYLGRPAVRLISLRQIPAQRPQIAEHVFRLAVFQLTQLDSQPLAGRGSSRSAGNLTRSGQMLRSMAPVQYAHRVRPVQVYEALPPLGPVHHRTHLCGAGGAQRCVSTVASRPKLWWSAVREK